MFTHVFMPENEDSKVKITELLNQTGEVDIKEFGLIDNDTNNLEGKVFVDRGGKRIFTLDRNTALALAFIYKMFLTFIKDPENPDNTQKRMGPNGEKKGYWLYKNKKDEV